MVRISIRATESHPDQICYLCQSDFGQGSKYEIWLVSFETIFYVVCAHIQQISMLY